MRREEIGLKFPQFDGDVDSREYFPASGHEAALAELRRALGRGDACALLMGGAGTGKSMLCRRLVAELESHATCAYLANGHMASRMALIQAILFELGIPFNNGAEQDLRLALTGYLLDHFSQGQRTIVVVDEAQHLEADLLEELRMLGNLECARRPAFQFVLAGLPALWETVGDPRLECLRQRVLVRVSLNPWDSNESRAYIAHSLESGEGRLKQSFTSEALELVITSSGGIPRTLCQVVRTALDVASTAASGSVDVEVVLAALSQLGLSVPESSAASELPPGDSTRTASGKEPAMSEQPSPPLTVATPDSPRHRRPRNRATQEGRLFAPQRRSG